MRTTIGIRTAGAARLGAAVVGAALAATAACGDDLVPAGAAGDEVDPGPIACATAWRDRQLGTALDDRLLGMAVDARGRVVVAGFERGVTGVTNLEPDGDARGVLIGLAEDGAPAWRLELDTPATDTLDDVARAPDTGALYAIGRTTGTLAGFTNAGQVDGVVLAVDAAGAPVGRLQFGDERPQHPARLALGDHALAIAGYDDTYIPSNYVEAWEDGFVARLTRDGGAAPLALTDLRKEPNPSANRITGVAIDRGGELYVTASATGSRARAGAFVRRLAADGSARWSVRLSAVPIDVATAIAIAPTGEVIVAGATVAALGGPGLGGQDVFVAALDPATGDRLWLRQLGSDASEIPSAIAIDAGGRIYVAGQTLGGVRGAPRGGLDAFAIVLDADGAERGRWQAGTAADDVATAIAIDGCGRVVVGGYTRGELVAGSAHGGDDLFVMRAAL